MDLQGRTSQAEGAVGTERRGGWKETAREGWVKVVLRLWIFSREAQGRTSALILRDMARGDSEQRYDMT